MANKKFVVTNDFIDKETGNEIKAGAIFEASPERESLLRAADVIGEEVSGKKAADAGKE